MIPLKLGMAAAVVNAGLGSGEGGESNAGSGSVSGDSSGDSSEGNDKDGGGISGGGGSGDSSGDSSGGIAEAIAETAVERPAVITEAAEMTKMRTDSEFSCELDTRSGNRIVFRFVGKCADPFAGRGRKLPVYT